MPRAAPHDLRFPCRSGWCAAPGIALIALWLALVAGFVAQTTAGPTAGETCTARQAPPSAAPAS